MARVEALLYVEIKCHLKKYQEKCQNCAICLIYTLLIIITYWDMNIFINFITLHYISQKLILIFESKTLKSVRHYLSWKQTYNHYSNDITLNLSHKSDLLNYIVFMFEFP